MTITPRTLALARAERATIRRAAADAGTDDAALAQMIARAERRHARIIHRYSRALARQNAERSE